MGHRIGIKYTIMFSAIASFIFAGPTGVGKTELTKALARYLFGSDEAMIRLDMSEFMEPHTISTLIGSPPGFLGYEEGGQLTEAIRHIRAVLKKTISEETREALKSYDKNIYEIESRLMLASISNAVRDHNNEKLGYFLCSKWIFMNI